MIYSHFCRQIRHELIDLKSPSGKYVLHFKRWSNKAYAIFNSIGKVVHIGFLAPIIHGLITVKSRISCLTMGLFHEINEEKENEAKFTIESNALIVSNQLFLKINVFSIPNSIEDSKIELPRIKFKKNHSRPHWAFFVLLRLLYNQIMHSFFLLI